MLFLHTLSPHQNTDILSSDLSPGVPRPVLSETAFSTPSTKQAKLLFVPVYAYLSVFRSHPALPHNKHQPNGHYDYGSVPRSFLTHVPGESPHHVFESMTAIYLTAKFVSESQLYRPAPFFSKNSFLKEFRKLS